MLKRAGALAELVLYGEVLIDGGEVIRRSGV
jgi:hypothetical protein